MARWQAGATVALAMFGLTAAAAPAATIHGQGVYRVDINEAVYTASPGESNHVVLGQQGDHARLADSGAVIGSTDSPLDSIHCLAALHTALCDGPSQWWTATIALGDGNDSLSVAAGQQKWAYGNVDGGPGNDDLRVPSFQIVGGPGADDLGGPGSGVHYDAATGPVSVTLDDRADDGQAGEGDNVRSQTSSVWGGAFGDRLVGGDTDNSLFAGAGDDVVSGGAGRDTLSAGPGDDVIDARDGEADTVFCGDGTDTVAADVQDTVAADCENVSLG